MSGFDENKYRDYHLSPGLMRINTEKEKLYQEIRFEPLKEAIDEKTLLLI